MNKLIKPYKPQKEMMICYDDIYIIIVNPTPTPTPKPPSQGIAVAAITTAGGIITTIIGSTILPF